MSGTAIITIGSDQWEVSLATTYWELTQGLGGITTIPSGTGMLFDLGTEQTIQVTTVPMLFPLDIAFLSSSLVVTEVVSDVSPGYIITSSYPARYFMEVNAGELQGVEVGDQASVEPHNLVQPAPDWLSALIGLMAFMVLGAFMLAAVRMLTRKMLGKPEVKLLPKNLSVTRPSRDDVSVHSWVERDRIGIWVTDNHTGKSVIEWWDEDAAQMFEDGFFKPGIIKDQEITGRKFEQSVLDYAEYIGALEKAAFPVTYLPQTIERGDVIEIPFKDAPAWVQEAWKQLHPGSIPRVKVYRTTVARIDPPFFEYAVRDIIAHKAGRTMSKYVPSYESLLAATPEEKALYFGGAVKLGPDEMIAVMDYWGDRFKSIDLYVHPAAYEPPKLIAPSLTDRQMKILGTIRAYTSAYRKEVFEANRVTQMELDELQRLGLIDRRGAITVLGRNVVGRESPLNHWGAWPMTVPTKGSIFIGSCKVSEGMCLTHGYSVNETVKCPQSPLTDDEWKAIWKLVTLTAQEEPSSLEMLPQTVPLTLEDTEERVKRYADSLWNAYRNYEASLHRMAENYRRAIPKAIDTYRQYVLREYERSKEEALLPQVLPQVITATRLDSLQIVKAYKQISAQGIDKIAVSLEAWAIFPRGRKPHFISMYRSGDEYVIHPLYAHIAESVRVPVEKVKAWIKSLPVRHYEPMAVAPEYREEAERLARQVDETIDILPLPVRTHLPTYLPSAAEGGKYAWALFERETGEIMIKENFSTMSTARASARAFGIRRSKELGTHTLELRLYDRSPNIDDLANGVIFKGQLILPEGRIEESLAPRLIGPTRREEEPPPEELEFFADSPDHIDHSMNHNGLRPKLEAVFQEAIARAKGLK